MGQNQAWLAITTNSNCRPGPILWWNRLHIAQVLLPCVLSHASAVSPAYTVPSPWPGSPVGGLSTPSEHLTWSLSAAVVLPAVMETQAGERAEDKIQRLQAQLDFTHTHYQKLLEQVHREFAVTARHYTFSSCLYHCCD